MTSVLRVLFRIVLLAAIGTGAWLLRDSPLLRFATASVAGSSPHQQFVAQLGRSGVSETPLGREWIASASSAVADAQPVPSSVNRTMTIAAERPVALAYLVTLKRGQLVDIRATLRSAAPAQTFIDVFPTDQSLATSLGGGLGALQFEAHADRRVIVRIQPELLRSGTLTIATRVLPAFLFPVALATARDLQSEFGVDRDGGRRQHEGVDIFAKRGTDVLSASAGLVTRVNETAIGGRVVWVWDPARALSVYYAHLDQQLVSVGTRMRPGDVLGTVGNTGNARTTSPHLHFGLYERGTGAIDPDAFIRADQAHGKQR